MAVSLGIKDREGDASTEVQRGTIVSKLTEFSRTYYILSDDTTDDEEDALACSDLPDYGDKLEGTKSRCVSKSIQESPQTIRHPISGVMAYLWEVVCDFSSDLSQKQADQLSSGDDPTSIEPTISWSTETIQVQRSYDIFGNPIQTEAGDPIEITTPLPIPVLTVRKYEDTPFDPNIMLDYVGAVNLGAFYGAPDGCAMISSITADPEVIEEIEYQLVTYVVKFRIEKEFVNESGVTPNGITWVNLVQGAPGPDLAQETWQAYLLHHGIRYNSLTGSTKVFVDDSSGTPATTNLNERGELLGIEDPDEAKVYLLFATHPYRDFGPLDLGPF